MTTPIEDAVDYAVRTARTVKEAQARKRDSDLGTSLFAYRGSDLIALVYPKRNRDMMLECANLAANGFDADILALVYETWFTDRLINPVTGKIWEAGELQDVVENHDARNKGWVIDSVMVAAVNRAGDFRGRNLPYRIVAKHLVWQDDKFDADKSNRDGLQHVGIIPDGLREIMQDATMSQYVARAGLDTPDTALFGLPHEETRAHLDCAIAKELLGQSGTKARATAVVLTAEEGTERQRIIRLTMPGSRTIRG